MQIGRVLSKNQTNPLIQPLGQLKALNIIKNGLDHFGSVAK